VFVREVDAAGKKLDKHELWNKVMFGFFEVSGRAVAELRQPGIKSSGALKRLSAEPRKGLLAR